MLLRRVVYLLLLKLVATVPISPTESSDAFIARGRYEPGVHTINNANPYQGVTVAEGHGKYPTIFEPLQNVQTSRSTYKVTSFIDFTPYLEYFQQFERYLEAFKSSISNFENDPVLQESESKLCGRRVISRGKHADIILLATHNLYFTSCDQ